MIKNKKFLKIDEFYKAAIDCAMDVDPRGRKIVEKELKDIKKDYDSITDKKRKIYLIRIIYLIHTPTREY